ncbi:Ca2+-dependent phosphoinositide-specific phospholipase C [Streptomyces sp. NPDC047028]|uniref:Ca2+-dependent phosphoinositide-specific phospholipase C n=1 Tax=Streptomyces sp. NPDC047028 TaxID=3155793 RepID=UPI00340FCDFA
MRHGPVVRILFRLLTMIATVMLVMAAWIMAPTPHAYADAGTEGLPLDQVSMSGLHNAYDPAKSRSLTQGLDDGAHFLEIDVYSTYGGDGGWIVSHADPLFNENNCQYTTGGIVRLTLSNGSLRTCLSDLRSWSDSHPGHGPVYLKLEMKWGLRSNAGMGPTELDNLVGTYLGAGKVFAPADMLGTRFPTLDAAARAGAWPTWDQLRGKFILYPITGTIEHTLAGYHLDNLSTEEEYADHVRDLAASGQLRKALLWPAMSDPAPGDDPRTQYDPSLRPWFVLFDNSASTWLNGQYDMGWYCSRHYLTVETAAESLAPPLDDTRPDPTAAAQRVQYLAEQGHSSATTFDWMNAPGAFAVWRRAC